MIALESARRTAALQALELLKEGYVVGLGSGRTMALAVKEIPAFLKRRMIDASFIVTSHQIEQVAIAQRLKLASLNECPEPDLALDGADQVDRMLNLIKGRGAALTKEKIVASAAKRFVAIVDEQKTVPDLSQPVPLEVIPFAQRTVIKKIAKIGGNGKLREGDEGRIGPIVTDNGNFVVDADFGIIENPERLESLLHSIPGIVESGLFVKMVNEVYVGKLNGTVEVLKR